MLAAAAVPLAAPGEALVPGAAEGAPRWLLGVYGGGLGLGGSAYLAVLTVAFVAYLGVAATAETLGRRLVWGAIIALVAGFALAPPLLSLDVFGYIAYARLGAEHGLNPYDAVPAALPGDPAASRVEDFRFAVSVYGPLFTLATYPLGLVGVPAALWALKAAAAAAVLGVAALTARLAAARGVSPCAAGAFVALNPLVLVHVVGGAHNDGLMVLGLVAASLALFGSDVLNALEVIGGNQSDSSHYSLPSTVSRITGLDLEPVRYAFLAAYAALVAWLVAWTLRGGDWVRAAAWAGAGLLVASAWLVPWYLIWALPFAAVARDRVLVAVVLAICAFQLPNALPL